MLKDAHVLLSGLKAHVTENSYSDIKTLRECCGGHGYLRVSGLPSLVEYLSALVTLEGDTFVMYLQAATQLVKAMNSTMMGKKVEGLLSYMGDVAQYAGKQGKVDPKNLLTLIEALKVNSLLRIGLAAQLIAKESNLSVPMRMAKQY